MSVRTFYLPNGNRIDIDDRGPNGQPNGILDRSDVIQINRRTYTLDELMAPRSGESAPLVEYGNPSGAWRFLTRELGLRSLVGVNLSHAHQIFGLREQARYLLTQPNPTPEQRRTLQSFINGSNELARVFGLPSITEADLRGLSSHLPGPAFPRWAALDCLMQSGWVFCAAGAPTSEESQIQEAQRHNRRVRIEISE